MGGGFVGAHYFVHRWKGHAIPEAPDLRRLSVQRLLADHDGRLSRLTSFAKATVEGIFSSSVAARRTPRARG